MCPTLWFALSLATALINVSVLVTLNIYNLLPYNSTLVVPTIGWEKTNFTDQKIQPNPKIHWGDGNFWKKKKNKQKQKHHLPVRLKKKNFIHVKNEKKNMHLQWQKKKKKKKKVLANPNFYASLKIKWWASK